MSRCRILLFIALALIASQAFAQTASGPKPSQDIQDKIAAALKLPDTQVLSALDKVIADAHAAHDSAGEAAALLGAGKWSLRHNLSQQALSYDEKASALFGTLSDVKGTADVKAEEGIIFSLAGNAVKGLEYYDLAVKTYKNLKMPLDVARLQNNMAVDYNALGKYEQALENAIPALKTYQELKLPKQIAEEEQNVGLFNNSLGRKNVALEYYRLALKGFQELNLPVQIANQQSNAGTVCYDLGKNEEALKYCTDALSGYQNLKMPNRVADEQSSIGAIYNQIGHLAEALEYDGRALVSYQKLGNPTEVARQQANIGNVYSDLGEPQRALEYENLALKASRGLKLQKQVADEQINIGILYNILGQNDQALTYYEMALREYTELKLLSEVARVKGSIGNVYLDLGQREKALDYYNRAVQSYQELGLADDVAFWTGNIGVAYHSLGQNESALERFEAVLPTLRTSGARLREAWILGCIGEVFRSENKRKLAIEAFKLAVDIYQSLRSNVKGLDAASQQSFRDKNAPTYRELTDLLIDEGRLAEAQHVLDLLKDEEFRRFSRAAPDQKVDLTAMEAAWKVKYDAMGVTLAEDQAELDAANAAVKAAAKPTQEQIEKQRAAQAKIEKRADRVREWLSGAETAFAAQGVKTDPVTGIENSADAIMDILGRLPNRTAAIYTLESADGVRTLLTLPKAKDLIAGPSQAIKAEELNRKIADFRIALTDPNLDPRPLGIELYNLLIRPIEKELAAYKTQAIVWSLDGSLRYLPLAALYDARTKKYLIEKYPCSLFVPALRDRLSYASAPIATALGFGMTRSARVRDLDFPALPGVQGELDSLHESFNAQLFVNDAFNAPKFGALLSDKPNLVHLGTHFQLRPGDEENSFLVLGDGTAFSAKDFFDLSTTKALAGIDLLVLSACDTATPLDANADGGETESFARIALQGGAAAVLATLWPVDDPSTSLLMGKFYALRKSGLGKLDALRQAQMWLMTASGKTGVTKSASTKTKANINMPRFKSDPAHPFAHPYFWAPFVLTGNAQ